ncbi:isochorismatase family protein [Lysobacter sp. F60174L2]|uniref:isochorismatase family protein n=1 Tax=Lysobacter sp. F60174L2 TaxID=3459295 RepID=UPI00403DDC8F
MRRQDKRTTPDGATALVIVDMINPLDFPGGAAMQPAALAAARRIARLKQRVKANGGSVVYANDNFTKWRMGFSEIVAICANDSRGADIARLLAPEPDDHFVLKPKHSAFFEAPLETLLTKLKARRLVITGLATDGCVLATAMDAHMREYRIHVPRDCVAAISEARTDRALELMKVSMDIDVRTSRYVGT